MMENQKIDIIKTYKKPEIKVSVINAENMLASDSATAPDSLSFDVRSNGRLNQEDVAAKQSGSSNWNVDEAGGNGWDND